MILLSWLHRHRRLCQRSTHTNICLWNPKLVVSGRDSELCGDVEDYNRLSCNRCRRVSCAVTGVFSCSRLKAVAQRYARITEVHSLPESTLRAASFHFIFRMTALSSLYPSLLWWDSTAKPRCTFFQTLPCHFLVHQGKLTLLLLQSYDNYMYSKQE